MSLTQYNNKPAMALTTTSIHSSYLLLPSKLHSSSPPPNITAQLNPAATPPPLYVSTNPSHVDLHHLRHLYAACNHSCHRFPAADPAVDPVKLRTALSNSPFVVSVFTKPEVLTAQNDAPDDEVMSFAGIGGDWIRKVAPVTPENGRLIGFGRAVSDMGLTASIYDVMVHPVLRRRGIGRMIVQRIIRMLTNRGIYDIAALCTDEERLFFSACGFGDDMLGSVTMMYTRSVSNYSSKDEQMISAGRKTLLVPFPRELKK